jgi:nucleoside-diphosphate-sugar epimerase
MATLLIIGGTGFFGKSILDSYKRNQLNSWKISKVIVMSRNAIDFKKRFPELISDGVELLVGDISTIDYLPEADFVIHAAVSTDASRYLSYNEQEKNNIIAGTLNYCRLASKYHKKSKIVYCSSGAVYGYQPKNIKFLKEDHILGDISKLDEAKHSYALAKRDSEIALQELANNNLNVAIARCFSFIGKYLPRDQHFAIGNFIADGIAGRDIEIKSTKKVYRSYMYADDLAIWLMTLAENANSQCPIYNVASDQEFEIREVAHIVSKVFNVGVKSVKCSNESIVDRYIPSVEKVKNELGLSEKYEIKDSILMSANILST